MSTANVKSNRKTESAALPNELWKWRMIIAVNFQFRWKWRMIIALTLLLGNVLWNGSIAKGSDFEGEADNPTNEEKKKVHITYWFSQSPLQKSVVKTKRKQFLLANHKTSKQSNKPIKTRDRYNKQALSQGGTCASARILTCAYIILRKVLTVEIYSQHAGKNLDLFEQGPRGIGG